MVTYATTPVSMPMHIPSPLVSGFHIGALYIHFYALMYLVGIAAAIIMTRRRWAAVGGDPELVYDVAMWSVPAGIIGGRIYFDITTPMDIPHVWYGVFAVWSGGLGIWGAIALAVPVGVWRVRKHGGNVAMFMDAVAPGLLVAQGIGRIGNYFNKELFGGPTSLPWGLEIPLQYRMISIPARYWGYSTFQPSFLYELIWDFALAAALIWAGRHLAIKQRGLFALYVTGYSAYRIFEESIRIDSSVYFLGLRLNMFVACALTIVGMAWFIWIQRHGVPRPAGIPAQRPPAGQAGEPGGAGQAAADGEAAAASGEAAAASDEAGAARAVDAAAASGEAGAAGAVDAAAASDPETAGDRQGAAPQAG
jgi:prolipoprotein diacylglyceryl transferase